jgi:hypothetical protein
MNLEEEISFLTEQINEKTQLLKTYEIELKKLDNDLEKISEIIENIIMNPPTQISSQKKKQMYLLIEELISKKNSMQELMYQRALKKYKSNDDIEPKAIYEYENDATRELDNNISFYKEILKTNDFELLEHPKKLKSYKNSQEEMLKKINKLKLDSYSISKEIINLRQLLKTKKEDLLLEKIIPKYYKFAQQHKIKYQDKKSLIIACNFYWQQYLLKKKGIILNTKCKNQFCQKQYSGTDMCECGISYGWGFEMNDLYILDKCFIESEQAF